MKIDKKTLDDIADLAKIKLSNQEKENFSRELSEVVAFVEKLNQVNDKTTEEKKYLSLDEVCRQDKIREDDDKKSKEIALRQAQKKSGLVIVPKIR